MKTLLRLLCLAIPLLAAGQTVPQNVQKLNGELTGSFNVGSGKAITKSGTGTVEASTVTGLSVASGKTLTASNTLTLTGTDSASVNFGAGGTVMYSGGGGGVTMLTGTANQITASAPDGSVTLSLAGPHNFTTLTSNNVLLGNGSSAPQAVAPGSSGNVLTSNGTTWASAAPSSSITISGTPTAGQVVTWAGASTIQGTSILGSTNGGTGNGFAKLSGPATSEKTFTLPNAAATILTDNATVTVAQGGTGATSLTSGALLAGAGTSPIGATNLSYSTPTLTVPDGFNVSSAGSIDLTAGGTNENVTITPNGIGNLVINGNTAIGANGNAFDRFRVQKAYTALPDNSTEGNFVVTLATGPSGSDSHQFRSNLNYVTINGATYGSAEVSGGYDNITNAITNGAKSVALLKGRVVTVRSNNAGTTGGATGVETWASNSGAGSWTTWRNFSAVSPTVSSSGTIGTAYGLYLEKQKVTGVTTGYGVYQADAADLNYFAGIISAGSAPTTLTDSAGKILSAALNTVGVAQGGTGSTTLTANNVLLGNGTSALQAVAPGSLGNVLTSNGTTWTSAAATGNVLLSANNAFTGINSFAGSTVKPVNALGAFAVDVTKGVNTKTISADQTFTFSGTPATANTYFSLLVTNSDTSAHTLTIPSSFAVGIGTITSTTIPASGKLYLTWQYDGSAYNIFGASPLQNVANGYAVLNASGYLNVAQGGIGAGSLTAYAPVFGGTTSTGAVQSGTAGTQGQVLVSNGAGVLPAFEALDLADADAVTGVLPTANQAVQTAALLGTYGSPDTTAGSITWTAAVYEVWTNTTTTYALPAASTYAGRAVIFYVVGTNAITIDPNGSEVIVRDGTAQTGGVTMTLTGAAGNYVCLVCDGTRWVTLGFKGTLAAGS